ncbi:MAG: hypothetical protein GWN16_01340, partial [Calditrichae bacterium]|nr:hypothetical protein [Calditrichia bacterium]
MTDGSKKIEQDQSADGKTQRDFSTAPAHQKIAFLVPGFARDEADSNCIPPLQQYVLTFSRIYPNIEIAVIAFQYPYRSGKYQWNGIDV